MRNKVAVLLVVIMIMSMFFIGCSAKEKVDKALISETEKQVEKEIEGSDDIKAQAQKEGISVKKMKAILDGLTEIGAEKYGVSKEDFIKRIEADGGTILSEWQIASEHMGITIQELYEYEKQSAEKLTDEQKQIMQGMGDAINKLEELDIENPSTIDVSSMLGIEENKTGEVRIVTLSDDELKESLSYEVVKITQDYTDEYSTVLDYTTSADMNTLKEHFENLLLNTEEYMKIGTPDSLVIIYQGKINTKDIYIEIDGTQEDGVTVKTYVDISSEK